MFAIFTVQAVHKMLLQIFIFEYVSKCMDSWVKVQKRWNEHCEFNSFLVKGKNINNLLLLNLKMLVKVKSRPGETAERMLDS